MKKLRFDVYSGLSGDKTYTETDRWVQEPGETIEELAERIKQRIIENAEQFLGDEDEA
jgi:hypothetical protein